MGLLSKERDEGSDEHLAKDMEDQLFLPEVLEDNECIQEDNGHDDRASLGGPRESDGSSDDENYLSESSVHGCSQSEALEDEHSEPEAQESGSRSDTEAEYLEMLAGDCDDYEQEDFRYFAALDARLAEAHEFVQKVEKIGEGYEGAAAGKYQWDTVKKVDVELGNIIT